MIEVSRTFSDVSALSLRGCRRVKSDRRNMVGSLVVGKPEKRYRPTWGDFLSKTGVGVLPRLGEAETFRQRPSVNRRAQLRVIIEININVRRGRPLRPLPDSLSPF